MLLSKNSSSAICLRLLTLVVLLVSSGFQISRASDTPTLTLPPSFSGSWQFFGRGDVKTAGDSVTVSGGYVANMTPLGNCQMSFRARMPADATQVQIWGAIRVKDRLSRYVFALRGGVDPEISLSRYAPDNGSKFLGFAPLDDVPQPGQWYTLRAVAQGKRIQIYLNDEKLPRINIEDKTATWTEGGVAIGGGWLPTEFTDVTAGPLSGDALAAFTAAGNNIWARPEVDKEALRVSQRAAYQPAKIDQLPAGRGEFSLDGNWLFMPDQTLNPATPPASAEGSDQDWHVIPVPSFWTPVLPWMGMGRKLNEPSFSAGPWDTLATEEYYRVEAQTFDWRKTTSGWYRHHVNLPANLAGKEFTLVFDAVAMISEVYVNGTEVGTCSGMFRRSEYDISKQLKPGDNVIAVHVITQTATKNGDAGQVAAVAVTVNVTNDMLRTMPHAMTDNASGIWQPVKLVVTNPVRVHDLFIQPRLDGAGVDVDLANGGAQDQVVTLSYSIRDYKDQSILFSGTLGGSVTVPTNGKATAHIDTPKLQPKLWSPTAPNLYILSIKLASGSSVTDEQETRFGFRTFTVDGSKLLLNGKPYWLRGGNHFPEVFRPNDAVLAHKFIELAKAGNVEVTRSHGLPFTETWLDASDELGMGVSYEGTWPWLMIKGEPPSAELLKVWKDEFSDLLREYRNHPSLLFWTVNNEMNFASFDKNDDALLDRKWTVLSDMIQTMRKIDPTRPIVAYSGYRRGEAKKSFEEVVTPKHYDDGDIDDAHSYYGWYNESFFHLFAGEYGKDAFPNRPLISQEMSTGYPRNDGWPSRSYDYSRQVAQSLLGDLCMEGNDPALFMTRQSFVTKELAEVIRRTTRDQSAGVLHFAYMTWFTNVWKPDQIKPKITYYELKKALQPILVSAELTGRHFYAGDVASRRLCLVNDDDNQRTMPAGKVMWEVRLGDRVLSQGSVDAPELPYYSNKWLDVNYTMPKDLPSPRIDAKLVLTYTAGGNTVSTNDYDIVVATHDWASVASGIKAQLLDPSGKAKDALAGIDVTPVTSVDGALSSVPLIIGDPTSLTPDDATKLNTFVQGGGRVLLLQPGKALPTLFPTVVKSFRAVKGEVLAMQLPESPVFDGIEPLDTAWFEMGQGNLPYACTGTYEVDRSQSGVSTLATECDFHSAAPTTPAMYFKDAGSPLIEIRLGQGRVIASEVLVTAKDKDPIAGRLLSNMIMELSKP